MPAAKTDYLVEETMASAPQARELHRVERRNRVLKLRRDGFTYDQISLALARGDDGKEPFEISARGVGDAVNAYVAELHTEDAETTAELRQIAHERLERMFRRIEADILSAPQTPEGRKQKERLIGQQIKILEREAKLHGLDAPVRHEHSGNVNIFALANPDHVAKVDAEFAERFGEQPTLELPAVTPDGS